MVASVTMPVSEIVGVGDIDSENTAVIVIDSVFETVLFELEDVSETEEEVRFMFKNPTFREIPFECLAIKVFPRL
jgi:hypothetical protein|tara:strand:+ start:157 stop:381 length:225 start_codon:yes stop_codon:yes gene_type:complete